MNKNTYFGLALAVCLSMASTHLLAEGTPDTKIREHLEPSEQQRQQAEHTKEIITAPETKIMEPLEPSELQRQQAEHNKEIFTAPETKINEPLEPSELQRQQAEHNKAIAK
jgi:hypothetical protein